MKIKHSINLTSLILALAFLPTKAVLADCPCSQDFEDSQTMQQENNNQEQDEQDINNADPDQ